MGFANTYSFASSKEVGVSASVLQNLKYLSKSKEIFTYDGLGITASCSKAADSSERIFLCATGQDKYNVFSQSYIVIYSKKETMVLATSWGKDACESSPEIKVFYTDNSKKHGINWLYRGLPYSPPPSNTRLYSIEVDKLLRNITGGYNRVFGCIRNDNYRFPEDSTQKRAKGGSKSIEDYVMPWDGSYLESQ